MAGTTQFARLALLCVLASAGAAPAHAQKTKPDRCKPLQVQYYLSPESEARWKLRSTTIDIPTFFAEFEKVEFRKYDTKAEVWRTFKVLSNPDKRTTPDRKAESAKIRAGTQTLLEIWNQRRELRDDRWLAYLLATALHETGQKMYPVREGFAKTDADAVAILKAAYDKRLQEDPLASPPDYWRVYPETGHSYFGRGYVQITWHHRYSEVDARLGETDDTKKFYLHPDLALRDAEAAKIAYEGMINAWFNSKYCLLRVFDPDQLPDPNDPDDQVALWKDARRIINGTDKWDTIGPYAELILEVIRKANREVQ